MFVASRHAQYSSQDDLNLEVIDFDGVVIEEMIQPRSRPLSPTEGCEYRIEGLVGTLSAGAIVSCVVGMSDV